MYDELESISFKEIVGYSIEGEEAAYNAYMSLSNNMKGLVADRFKSLAEDEELHKNELLKLHEKEFGNRDYVVPDKEGLPPHEGEFIKVKNVKNLVDAIEKSMEAEYNAYRIYKYLAENQDKYSTLFEYIAVMEKGHYETLKAEKKLYERGPKEKEKETIRPFFETPSGMHDE